MHAMCVLGERAWGEACSVVICVVVRVHYSQNQGRIQDFGKGGGCPGNC